MEVRICPTCQATVLEDANFCTSCGNPLGPTTAGAPGSGDVGDDDAPTQVFDIPGGAPTAGEHAASMDVELVTCPACGSPNASLRRRCGRCDADLDVEHVPDLFTAPSPAEASAPTIDDQPTVPPLVRPEPDVGRRPVDDDPTVPPHLAAGRDDDTLPPGMRPLLAPVVDRSEVAAREGPREPTGRLPVIDRTVRRPDDVEPVAAPDPGRARRWPIVVGIVVAVLAGAVAGFAIATGTGPFDRSEAPVFSADRYPDEPTTLFVVEATATSSVSGASPEDAVDDDSQTAWIAEVDDEEPALTVELAQPSWLASVVIATGEPASTGGAAGSGRVIMAFLDIGDRRVASLVLRDQPGEQVIRLLTPALAERVTITVGEVGDLGPAAITSLSLEGHVATEEAAATRS